MNELNQEQLSRIYIKGFKSIKECEIELSNINVLIGSNGAGKSNFISIFELLKKISEKRLSSYAQEEGAGTLFYNGTKETDSFIVGFYFGSSTYSFELKMTKHDSLEFFEENVGLENSPWSGSSYSESNLKDWYNSDNPNIDKNIKDAIAIVLRGHWHVYHFHDSHSIIKPKNYNISNNEFLQKDAANLAAFLFHLREHYTKEYNYIVEHIRTIAPYFKDFILKPKKENEEHIILHWQKKDCDEIFNASQLSDGTLRFICLATLLLQPAELQPATIIIDEPELGLHPYAITILAEMVQKAADNKQIILATQSVELLNKFELKDIVVVDSGKEGSEIQRREQADFAEWLEDYKVGELWNKNILGGRFAR